MQAVVYSQPTTVVEVAGLIPAPVIVDPPARFSKNLFDWIC